MSIHNWIKKGNSRDQIILEPHRVEYIKVEDVTEVSDRSKRAIKVKKRNEQADTYVQATTMITKVTTLARSARM